MSKNILKIENLNLYYDDKQVLKDLNLNIEKNSITAISGPSGIGKSSLLLVLNQMIKEYENASFSGKVYFNDDNKDIDITTLSNKELPNLRKKIVYVSQHPDILPFSIFENLYFPLKLQKIKKDDAKKLITEVLKKVHLYDEVKNRLENSAYLLSGGQQQRLILARALILKPKVLLLDEPFAAIDAKVRSELRLWLKEMVSKLGITSIFVTHDQDEAVEVADEILITNHGKIEQMGSPLEIYKSPKTPFVAQFVGRSSIVENYESLKGFEKIEHAQKAIVRPEFLELAKKGELKRYMSASEKGIVEDVIFSGSRLDVVVNINGIKVTAERSLEKDPVSVGEEVDIIIYRLYVFDEKETYLLENKEMQEGDVFYI